MIEFSMDTRLLLFSGVILGLCIHTHAEVVVPQNFYAVPGTTVTIPCLYDAQSQAQIYFEGQVESQIRRMDFRTLDIGDGISKVLLTTLSDVTLSDTGTYVCTDVLNPGSKMSGKFIVFEPEAPKVGFRIMPSADVELTWHSGTGRGIPKGYMIFVSDKSTVEIKTFTIAHIGAPDESQNFQLKDLLPGATYEMQMQTVYIRGDRSEGGNTNGPNSEVIELEIPVFESPPVNVKAEPWKNSTIRVTWDPPPNAPENIDHYLVIYKRSPWRKNAHIGRLTVNSSNEYGQWEVVIDNLKPKVRYSFSVFAVQNGKMGKRSRTPVLRYDEFLPELSIRAIPLGPMDVMVTLEMLWGQKLSKIRVHYSDDTATKWIRIDGCNERKPCLIGGLKPGKTYFFIARGKLEGKAKHVVTHVIMPPTELDIPVDLTVKALNDHSIEASWNYPTVPYPIGYLLNLDMAPNPEDQFRPFKQVTVFRTNSAPIDGLQSGDRYRLRVVPFNGNGPGIPSESTLFSVGPLGTKVTTAPLDTAPRIIDSPPALMQVDAGDDVTLRCIATGDPAPLVMWKNKYNQILSQSVKSVVNLELKNLQTSTAAICEAVNSFGISRVQTRIDVSRGIELEDYEVRLNIYPIITNEPTKSAVITWSVESGNLEYLKEFRWKMYEHATQTKKSMGVSPNVRNMRITNIKDDQRYNFTMQTFTPEGLVNSTNIQFDKYIFEKVEDVPDAVLDVVEIRDKRARIGVVFPRKNMLTYRIQLKDLFERIANTIFNKTQSAKDVDSLAIVRLKPAREYQVILEAYPQDGSEPLTANVTFMTAFPGKSGIPVKTEAFKQNTITTTTTTTTMATTTTTPSTPTNMNTTEELTTTIETTTEAIVTNTTTPPNDPVTSSQVMQTETTTPMDAGDYELNIKTTNPTPNLVSIRWSMNRGNLEDISYFIVIIKFGNGIHLLTQKMGKDKRYISVQPLTPNTPYIISIEAKNKNDDLLADSEVKFVTPPKGHSKDTSMPFLQLEANEIRSSSARIEWDLVTGDTEKIMAYDLLVFDRDENGANLLNQRLSHESASLNLQQLPPNRQFYVKMIALDMSDKEMVSQSLTFQTPSVGQYGTPVSVTAPPRQRRRRATTAKPIEKPVLWMEIKPSLPYGARLDWVFSSGKKNIDLRRYRLKVKETDSRGALLIKKKVSRKTPFFDMIGLQPEKLYFIEVGAIDRYGRLITKVSSSYRLPPPGFNVQTIHVTSNDTDEGS